MCIINTLILYFIHSIHARYISRGVSAGLPAAGLFGTAVATMGMLSTVVFVLAMDVPRRFPVGWGIEWD